MKRRDVLTSVFIAGLAAPVMGDQPNKDKEQSDGHGDHGHHDDDGRLKNVTVSFGHWNPTPGTTPIDRFAADPNPRTLNGHAMIPSPVKIHVGDTVSFVISGFHNLQIFGPGTQPSNIDRTKLLLSPPNTFPPIIDDPNHRVYRGLDPRVIATVPTTPGVQDRVESVGFNAAGRYLVICGVLPHFFDAATGSFVMFGFVDVRDDN